MDKATCVTGQPLPSSNTLSCLRHEHRKVPSLLVPNLSEDRKSPQPFKSGPFPRYEYPGVTASDYLKPSFEDARDAIGPPSARHTPLSLGWSTNSKLSNLYKLTVQKGKEPYFELCPPWSVTAQTPSRVYLDHEP
jgi:hypothetical protein